MNWYFKTILAQAVMESTGLVGYLERIGAAPDIIQYITTQEENTTKYLANEFRKNPSLTIQQLQQVQLPQKTDPYLKSEYNVASSYPEIQQWILINFKKIRKGKMLADNSVTNVTSVSKILTPEENAFYFGFKNKLDEIYDWATRAEPRPEIASYTAEQAIEETDEWHRMIAGKGEGKYYEPIKKELIVYGPKWKSKWSNKDWQGWTIQKVESQNDLLAEGNKMDHCVGSYYNEVRSGSGIIYSLRDPQNNPYVTIETDGTGKIVEQLKGHSNEVPDEEYGDMIAEWVNNAKDSPVSYNPGSISWEMEGELNTINSNLEDLINGYVEEENSYESYFAEQSGLKIQPDNFTDWLNNFDIEELMKIIFKQIGWESSWNTELEGEWLNEPIVDTLLKAIDLFEPKIGRKYLWQILKGELGNTPTMIDQDDEVGKKFQESFAKHLLELMSIPEGQQSFDFTYSSKKNWYKKNFKTIQPFLRSLPYQ